MILSISGEEATGKTTLSYSAPLPIVGFSFDVGTERAIMGTKYDELFKGLKIEFIRYKRGDKAEKRWAKNDITIFEIPQPIQLDQSKLVGFMDCWEYFIGHLGMAAEDCQEGKLSTVVVDTMTLARRIKADAYLEELQRGNPGNPRKQLIQIEYGHANDSIRNIYTLFSSLRANFVAIHHLTDEYRNQPNRDGQVESVPTGQRVLEGLAQTYRYIDVGVRMEKGRGADLSAVIEKCGYSLELSGQRLPNPTWNKIVGVVSMSISDRILFQRREGLEVSAK